MTKRLSLIFALPLVLVLAAQARGQITQGSGSSGGGGGAPSGPAGGLLTGTYPNPGLAAPYGATTYTAHGFIVGEGASNLAATAACAIGSFPFGQGSSADPVCSTLILPNAATQGDLLTATGANTIGSTADVAVGQVLTSGGVGAVPVYSASPAISGANITSLNAGNVSSGTLAVAQGGTNAATAGAARTNLGIAYTVIAGTNTTQLATTATTQYFNGFLGAVSATETNTRSFISQPTATCSNLNCMVLTTPGAGNTHVFTLRTPTGTSPASGPTCTISNPSTTCSDTTHTAACGAASFTIQDTTTGTPTASVGACTFQVSY